MKVDPRLGMPANIQQERVETVQEILDKYFSGLSDEMSLGQLIFELKLYANACGIDFGKELIRAHDAWRQALKGMWEG